MMIYLIYCANCGKGEEGSDSLKACTACKLVKYCNRECQIAHRSQHKKECKKRAAELHDEELFKQPPTLEDCPICFQRLPTLLSGSMWYGCCGKTICSGCCHAPVYDNEGNIVTEKGCPFCRTPLPTTDAEMVEREKKRVEAGDAQAMYNLGCDYAIGDRGLSQDYTKALELWHRAGELGSARSYFNIGIAYDNGRGVEVNKKKARHYFELAAMQGHVNARHNLGGIEGKAGKHDLALRHFMIAVKDGDSDSLKAIRIMYLNGHATKDDYTNALRLYQAYLDDIKSDQRDNAAAEDEDFKYIE